eukprot:jgi/Galph1/128/GphlegSOOS_G4870.1
MTSNGADSFRIPKKSGKEGDIVEHVEDSNEESSSSRHKRLLDRSPSRENISSREDEQIRHVKDSRLMRGKEEKDREDYRLDRNSVRLESSRRDETRPRQHRKRISQWDVRKLPWEKDDKDSAANRSSYSVGGLDFSALSQYMIPVAPSQSNSQQATKHSRRVYVGNLPSDVTEAEVAEFFNSALYLTKGVDVPGDPVQSVYLNLDKRFAFIELNSSAEASAAIQMDGVLFRGMSLRMRRPNDYNPSIHAPVYPPVGFDPSPLGIVSTQVPDGPDKVFIGGLPYHLTEDQIKEILSSYDCKNGHLGPLNAFNLVKDPNTGLSKGYAFLQYKDPSIVDAAIKGLNGMTMGDKTLTVRRASQISVGTSLEGMSYSPTVRHPTKALELRNMVEPEELVDDEEYEDIIEDIREESSKYGELVEIKVPRPSKSDEANPPGVGKVFLVYSAVADAEKAFAALTGRRFAGKSLIVNYFDEDRYHSGHL